MNKYQATFSWTMTCTRVVEAQDESDAFEKANAKGLEINVDRQGWYVEESFGLDSLAPYGPKVAADCYASRQTPETTGPTSRSEAGIAPRQADGQDQDNQSDENDLPLLDLKAGRVQVQIWKAQSKGKELPYRVSVSGPCADRQSASNQACLVPDQIPHVLTLLAIARDFLREHRAAACVLAGERIESAMV